MKTIQYVPKNNDELEQFKAALHAYQKDHQLMIRFSYKALPFKTYGEAIAYATTGKFPDQN